LKAGDRLWGSRVEVEEEVEEEEEEEVEG